MKNRKIGLFLVAALMLFTLASCDMINNFINSRLRDVPVIEIYNSNLERTRKLLPNDTLFVEVGGLKPFDVYEITCKDPEGKTITVLNAQADEDGMISPSPLWYDIGFKRDPSGKPKLASDAELGLSAFNINVKNVDPAGKTDLTLPFWVVYNTDIARPQPIVMAGTGGTGDLFELENSFQAGDQLWVKVANLKANDPLPPGQDHATVYLIPFKGTAILDGDAITPYYLKQEFSAEQLMGGVLIDETDQQGNDWGNGVPNLAAGRAFSIILDCDNNSLYDVRKDGLANYFLDAIDGNMVPGFVVQASPTAAYVPANIASGGKYTWDNTNWTYDYDYRDKFKIEGWDTQYAWDWQFGGYGVKATWNPYISWSPGPTTTTPGTPSIYYGTYVDVYIIDHLASYTKDATIVPSDNWGLTKLTMPVQYSCYNGCGQQTIWRSDGDANPDNGGLAVGKYDVVVDVDRNGRFTDGDIIDNQPRNITDTTNFPARADGGFEVVLNY